MTTRVFTQEVEACWQCKFQFGAYCRHPSVSKPDVSIDVRGDLFDQNVQAITPSCPMYQHSFVKDEKK